MDRGNGGQPGSDHNKILLGNDLLRIRASDQALHSLFVAVSAFEGNRERGGAEPKPSGE